MTRNRTVLMLLAGLVLLATAPAFGALYEPRQIFEYPGAMSVQGLFHDEQIIDIPKPPLPPNARPGLGTSTSATEESSRFVPRPNGGAPMPGGGGSMLGSNVDTGMGKPDIEAIIRSARRDLDG